MTDPVLPSRPMNDAASRAAVLASRSAARRDDGARGPGQDRPRPPQGHAPGGPIPPPPAPPMRPPAAPPLHPRWPANRPWSRAGGGPVAATTPTEPHDSVRIEG